MESARKVPLRWNIHLDNSIGFLNYKTKLKCMINSEQKFYVVGVMMEIVYDFNNC